MDPLSITASVIAVIGALRAVTKGYKCITVLGKASQEFIDLVDEIESVYAYVGMLHSVLGSNTQAFAAVDLTPLGASLSRLDYTIQRLQSALTQVEADSKTSGERRISKTKWQIYKSKVIQLRDEVHARKQDLVDKVGILQLALSVLHTNLLPIAHVREEISYTRHDKPTSGGLRSTALLNDKQNNALDIGPRSQIQRFCSARCSCRCHRPSAASSQPWLLSTIRQILSLVVTRACWELMLCDDQVCRDATQQKLALVCQIPFFQYAVWLRLAWTSVFGPGASLYLRVARVVTYGSAHRAAAFGTPQRLRYLFENRMALPNDMTPYGKSLLLVAVIFANDEVIDYLLELGADVFQSDFFGCSPALLVRYVARHRPDFCRGNSRVQMLAEDCYGSKLLGNPLLEALENDTDVELEHILNKRPSLVNDSTEFGSSPLHIAIKLQRYSTMKLLLLRRADPRKQNMFAYSPLQWAIYGNDCEAIQILLPFANDSNLLDRSLGTAIQCSSNKVVSLLLSSSVKIQARLPNAFERLARRNSLVCNEEDEIEAIAHHLLNAGLNFDDYGGTPCERAVKWNRCCILRVLLKLGAKFCSLGKRSVLRVAATYATLDTIELLREANIKEHDPDAEWDGWTAMELFEYRKACTDGQLLPLQTRPTAEESIAFRALIDEVRERYNSARTLLETNNPEIEHPGKNDFLLSEEDGKVVGEQTSLPGAWVE
ncbi:ankyrin repeat-containing domain protein [Xylaria acuta]|nr:ankyrin repeat-containing domain protein [Xylaria acuta]